jgi:hypothetical protein
MYENPGLHFRLTVTGLHSEGRGRCPAHHYPSPGTKGCGSYTLGHSLGPRGCGSSSRGRGGLIRPPWVPPFSEQKNFRLFLYIFLANVDHSFAFVANCVFLGDVCMGRTQRAASRCATNLATRLLT